MMNSGKYTKKIAKNTVFLYIRMLILMLVSLYTTRVLLKVLGIDDYGIFNVVGGLIVMITFINEGLAGASRRYILAELASGNLQSQCQMYTCVLIAHVLISILIIILGETLGLWIFSSTLNIPESRQVAAMSVFHISLLSSIASIMLTPANSVIIAEENMSAYAYFSIADALMRLLIVWLLILVNGDKLVIYAYLLFVVGIIDLLMYYLYCYRKFQMCRIVKSKVLIRLRELYGYMGWTVFGLGASMMSRQGVIMLVNVYYNVAVNAAIGISNMIINTANKFVCNFQLAFTPQLVKNYLSQNEDQVNNLVCKSSRYSSILVLVMLIPISIVITDLLKIWLGEYPPYTEAFCLLTFVCIYFEALSNPLTTVITSDKSIRKYQVVISFIYFIDFLMCWFVLFWGCLPYSVIIVRLTLGIVGVLVRLYMTKSRVPTFSVRDWVQSVIGKGIIIALLSSPLLLLKHYVYFHDNTIGRFLFNGFISCLWVFFLSWVIGLTANERSFASLKVLTYLRRKRW